MLKLHFYFLQKLLALMGLLIIVILGFTHYFFGQLMSDLFTFIFLLQFALFGISFYMEDHFIHLLRTMPIAKRDFITSAYVFAFLTIGVISIPIMLHQFYRSQLIATDSYTPYVTLGILAVSLVHIGMQLKQYFSDPTKNQIRFNFPNLLLLLLVLFLPHSLIIIFSNAFLSTKLGSFIIPIVSVWIYYKLCQSAITKFENVEF